MRPMAVVLTLVAVLAAAIGSVYYAQSGSNSDEPLEVFKPAPPDGPHPKAVVDEDTFDFGVMELRTERSHAFVVRNEGEGPLKLAKGESTCKCTLSELAKDEIPPGEEAIVTLTWKPESIQEDFQQSAHLITNEPTKEDPEQNRTIRLTVMGKVVSSVSYAPEHEWSVGIITENGEPGKFEGTIYSKLLDEFEIKSIEKSSDYLTTEAMPLTDQEKEMLEAKSGYRIDVTVSSEIPVGVFEEELTIKTDVNEGAEFVIPVQATRTGPVHIIPGAAVNWNEEKMMLTIPRFAAAEGKKTTLSVFIRDPEGTTKITKVETDNALLKASVKEDEKFGGKNQRRYELTLEIPAGQPPTRFTDDSIGITMSLKHPTLSAISLNCQFLSY